MATSDVQVEGHFLKKVSSKKSTDPVFVTPIDEVPTNLVYPNLYSCKSTTDSILVDYTVNNRTIMERLISVSPTEEFMLRKNSPGDTFYLEFQKLGNSWRKWITDFNNDVLRKIYTVSSVDANDLLDESQTKFSKIESLANKYKIWFERKAVGTANPFKLSGWFVVDPQLSWAIREYNVTRDYTNPDSASFQEYGFTSYADNNTLPVPKEIYSRVITVHGLNLIHAFKADVWKYTPVDSKIFTASFYGLAQLDRPPLAKSDYTVFWGLAIAVVALAISLLSRRNFKLRSANQE